MTLPDNKNLNEDNSIFDNPIQDNRNQANPIEDKQDKGIKNELESPNSEWLLTEYQYSHARWTNGTNQRRVGLAFFTTVQGGVLTMIGDKLLDLNFASLVLGIFGFLVSIISWNHERRIGAYMKGYRKRAVEIERQKGLKLIQYGKKAAKEEWTLSNRKVFSWYFLLIFLGWLFIFFVNFLKYFHIITI